MRERELSDYTDLHPKHTHTHARDRTEADQQGLSYWNTRQAHNKHPTAT